MASLFLMVKQYKVSTGIISHSAHYIMLNTIPWTLHNITYSHFGITCRSSTKTWHRWILVRLPVSLSPHLPILLIGNMGPSSRGGSRVLFDRVSSSGGECLCSTVSSGKHHHFTSSTELLSLQQSWCKLFNVTGLSLHWSCVSLLLKTCSRLPPFMKMNYKVTLVSAQ